MNKRQESAIKVAEDIFDKMSKQEAHAFKNFRAAVRLLCGAFASRDISDIDFKCCIQKFARLEHVGEDPEEFASKFLETSISYRADLQFETGDSLPIILNQNGLEGKKLLLVDDQAKSAGWEILMRTLIADQVAFALAIDEAKESIENHTFDYACVLLDLQLPNKAGEDANTPDEGVNLLKWIKSQDVSLPVVVFSGVDEVQYARRCFEAGSEAFFVKELNEEVRSYIGYFRRFKKTLAAAIAHSEWRSLWRRVCELPDPGLGQMGSVLFRAVFTDLRRAYFFLTSGLEEIRAQLIFENPEVSSVYDECVLQCGIAVERVVVSHINKLDKKKAKLQKKQSKNLGLHVPSIPRSYSKLAFSSKADESQLKILQEEKILDTRSVELAKEIWQHRNRAAHPGGMKRTLPSHTHVDAVLVFEQALEFAERYFANSNSLGMIDG